MKTYQGLERDARDRAAEQYDGWYTTAKGPWFDRREQSIFGNAVPPQAIALDLGSGTGRITQQVGQRAAFAVAADFSLNSLTCLQNKRLPRVAAVGADAVAGLPFRTGTFDAVVSCQVLQHLRREDLISVLGECHRVLKNGGRFCVSVYNLEYWRFHGVPEKVDEAGLYFHRFNAVEIKELAAAARFSVRRIGYYKTLPSWVSGRHGMADHLIAKADRCLCSMPLLRRFGSCYLFAELKAV